MIYLTEEEWVNLKAKLVKISPKALLILIVFIIGFSSGWHMKGNDIVMDCKYSSAFRIDNNSFACARKL